MKTEIRYKSYSDSPKYVVRSLWVTYLCDTEEEAKEAIRDIYDSTCGPAIIYERKNYTVEGRNNEIVQILSDEDYEKVLEKWRDEYSNGMGSTSF